MTHPPSSRREGQKTEDVQLSEVNARLKPDGREPSIKITEISLLRYNDNNYDMNTVIS